MQVENHKEEVPFSHYEGLFRSLDPAEAQKRLPSVRFSDGTFALTLLGREYRISWPEYAIVPADGGTVPPLPEQTFLLRCLLEGKETAFGGRMLTFREMPWGELYSKPFAGRVHHNDIRVALLFFICGRKYFLGFSHEKFRIGNVVADGILPGVVNGLRNDFHAVHLFGTQCHK